MVNKQENNKWFFKLGTEIKGSSVTKKTQHWDGSTFAKKRDKGYPVKPKYIYKYAGSVLSSVSYYKAHFHHSKASCFFFWISKTQALDWHVGLFPVFNCIFKDLAGIMRLTSCYVYHVVLLSYLLLIWRLMLFNKCLLSFSKCTLVSNWG